MKKHLPLLLLCLLVILSSCDRKVNQKKYYQFSFYRTYEVGEDSIGFKIQNPLLCPLRVNITLDGAEKTDERMIWLKPRQDTTFSILNNYGADPKIRFGSAFSTFEEITLGDIELSLPIQANKSYKINQGYNGSFSHQSDYSRYSIDFDLKVGDTVYCAADGYVVGVIKDYDNNGGGKKMRDQANFITVFHPDLQVFTQYVHLLHKGSFVQLGDTVKSSQPLGLSGNTGFTQGPHLHFNVLKATVKSSFESVPVRFEGGIDGFDLKRGKRVVRKSSSASY